VGATADAEAALRTVLEATVALNAQLDADLKAALSAYLNAEAHAGASASASLDAELDGIVEAYAKFATGVEALAPTLTAAAASDAQAEAVIQVLCSAQIMFRTPM
jgi:hypothetical protein